VAAIPDDDVAKKAQSLVDKGLTYLKGKQDADFSWSKDFPGVNALVLKAFVQDPAYDPEDKFLDKGFEKLLSCQKEDGSISQDMLATYNTAIAISALAASKEGEYKEQLRKALDYLKGIQWSDKIEGVKGQNEKVGEDNVNYGGWGYGRKGRADMSNVQIAMDALHDAGLDPKDEAYQRALKFISRSQNLSETNKEKWAGNDGSFIYTPAGGKEGATGESMAGEYVSPDGKRMLRGYGSMTYAGLKSMIYAGLTKDDPRVKAAWSWITKHWTLDENPGMREGDPEQAQYGMFYYYFTLARALNAYDEPVITDGQGNKHDWRAELVQKLIGLQKEDGSWQGDKKWMEDNAVLTTAYVVLTLQEVQQDLKQHPAKPAMDKSKAAD